VNRATRRLPLSVRLPLMMSLILATVLGVAVIGTYTTLRSYAVARVTGRLESATRQIATLGANGIGTQYARYLPVANDSAVRRALRTGSADLMTHAALRRASLPTDSGMPVELWTADGRRIAFIGNDLRTALQAAPGKPELPDQIAAALDARVTRSDTLMLGPLYGAANKTYLWNVMPVRENRRVIGYIAHQRRIAPSPQTQRTLRDMSGDSVSLHWRNADGSYWAAGTGQPTAAFTEFDSAASRARAPDGSSVLFHEERIAGTPIVVGMSVPYRNAVASPQRSIRRLFILGFVLLIVGTIASWLIGRSVARPIADVTRAAGALATGDYEARVPDKGDVEVRRLADMFNHMAREIGASRAALQRQTQTAEAANNAKSEFLTTMSHELRTPLNAIGGYAELIEMGLRGPVTDAQKRDLQRIRLSQQHLLGLISSVLDLSRIEAGRVVYDLVNVSVDPFLSSLDGLVAPQAASKQITLQYLPCPPSLAVIGDREKLRQVLLNLLSNAIRHTPPGGTITLSGEGRGSLGAIIVDDTGPGIPEDKREEIFEPFVQLDRSLSSTREGIGLGLAISRDLARGMSGDLVVEPLPSRMGARFVLTLPRGVVGPDAEPMHSGEMPVGRAF
jgi:signal transduction histidine kinase